jgi:hypothetical protein
LYFHNKVVVKVRSYVGVLALPITNLKFRFSNLKGILVNVKKGLPPFFFFIPVLPDCYFKDKLIIGKPYNA